VVPGIVNGWRWARELVVLDSDYSDLQKAPVDAPPRVAFPLNSNPFVNIVRAFFQYKITPRGVDVKCRHKRTGTTVPAQVYPE